MRWLMPRDDTFFVLFERSAATMVEAAEALGALFSGGRLTMPDSSALTTSDTRATISPTR